MKIVEGNILDVIKNRECDVVLHVCNCFHTMGAGLALQLKQTFPEVYEADLKTEYNDYNKMGTLSIATIDDNIKIVNMYAQYYFGRERRQLDYSALKLCLKKVKHYYAYGEIVYPYLMGCGLAGGDWKIVSEIIDTELSDLNHRAIKFKQ